MKSENVFLFSNSQPALCQKNIEFATEKVNAGKITFFALDMSTFDRKKIRF